MADCSGATTIQRVCSSLGDQAVGALCRPSPRHEFVDTRGRPQVDKLGEHVGQIGLRVDTVELAGLCRPPNYAEWLWEEAVVWATLRPV